MKIESKNKIGDTETLVSEWDSIKSKNGALILQELHNFRNRVNITIQLTQSIISCESRLSQSIMQSSISTLIKLQESVEKRIKYLTKSFRKISAERDIRFFAFGDDFH